MAKTILKNETPVRIIDGASLARHWMRAYYKSIKSRVDEWNSYVPPENRMFMRKEFKLVRDMLIKKIESCGLNSKKEIANVFLTAMKWTRGIESQALKSPKMKIEAKRWKAIDGDIQDIDVEILILEKLCSALELVRPIISSLTKEHPQVSKVGALIESQLEHKISDQEERLEKLSERYNQGKSRLHKDEVLFELAEILSKKTQAERNLKKSRAAAGEIIGFIFREPKPKTGWDKAVGMAIKRYTHENPKKKINKK